VLETRCQQPEIAIAIASLSHFFVSFIVVVQLGLSLDEGALLEESMLDDAAVQVRLR
jgi:hypothetical protein